MIYKVRGVEDLCIRGYEETGIGRDWLKDSRAS